LTCLLAVIFGVGLVAGWAFAHSSKAVNGTPANASTSSSSVGSNSSTFQTAQEVAIARVEPSVVEIQGATMQGTSLGSGIIVDTKGDIVTNNHVVSGATSLKVVLSNGSQETAQLVGTNPANDLAIIHIQPFANMAVATLGDSSQLTVGQEVLAIGNPLGYSGSASEGVVSALNRSMPESSQGPNLTGLIQTSAAINPGNSGGALINLQGQVVGIPTLSAINSETNTPANGIGFAIPANQVQAAVAQIVGK
jgi:putative serine protease PepD